MVRIFLVPFFSCLVLAFVASDAFGQKGNNSRQDEKKENERVAKAERAVSEAKKDLAGIQKALRSEANRLEKLVDSLHDLRKQARQAHENAEDRLGAKIGIPDALAKVRGAGAAKEQCASKVRRDVHATSEWAEAKAAADQAKETRLALLEDLNQEDDGNNQQLNALLKQILKPMNMENEAIEKDASAIEAGKLLAQYQAELERLRKLLPSGQVEKEREVVQAMQAVNKKEKEVNEVELQFKKSKAEASKLQKRLVEAQVSLQRAKAADAADPNRPGKTKGK